MVDKNRAPFPKSAIPVYQGPSMVPKPPSLANPAAVLRALKAAGDPARAKHSLRFFRTGAGEYGEGDRFLGITVPTVRSLVKATGDLSLRHIEQLLESEWHEARLFALLVLVRQFQRRTATDKERRAIYDLYLRRSDRINNWDLVDCSAEHIVGGWLRSRSRAPLKRLVRSELLWDRRIAIVATFHFIKRGDAKDILALAPRVFNDGEDLMHKATGWMLREAGKRVGRRTLTDFLDVHAPRMPRIMLRYALERLPATDRKRYLRTPRAA